MSAAAELLRAWYLVRFRKFRTYSGTLGEIRAGEFVDEAHSVAALQKLRDVRWALRQLNGLVRGRLTCLMLAIAGKRLLDRRGLANTLVLGVRPDKGSGKEPMGAHAWLLVGRYVVIGLEEKADHIPVASYYSHPEQC